MEDPNGNFLTFTYFKDSGQVYPEEIHYTGYGTDPGIYTIQFSREPRTYVPVSYITGFQVQTKYRINEIAIYTEDSGSPELAYAYELNYHSTGSVVETLASIQLKSDTATLPPLEFAYYTGNEDLPSQKIHLLKKITYPLGATAELVYQPSTAYKVAEDLANPNLPFRLHTLHTLTTQADSTAPSYTTTYTYAGGHYYFDYADAYKREYAGFHEVAILDPGGNLTKHFFHQSEFSLDNAESSLNGEFEDHIAKKGHIYRTEIFDSEDNLLAVTLQQWDKRDLTTANPAQEHFFPFLARKVSLAYEGEAIPKATATEFTYDDFGNLIQVIDYGEVTLTDESGNFTDDLADKITTTKEYSLNEDLHILALPFRSTRTNFAGEIIGEQKTYYDDLALGQVSQGNPTKQEVLVCNTAAGCSADTYLTTQTTYNEFGLPLTQTNPRGFTTTLTYDEFHLYPIVIINPKAQATTYSYAYNFGKVLAITDPNGLVTKNLLDDFGRIIEQQMSNPADPTALITTQNFTYNLTAEPANFETTISAGHDNIAVTTLTYLDGFGQVVQTRTETEEENQYLVTSFIYDEAGRLQKELLPQFTTGLNFTEIQASDPGTLLSYDALSRVIAVTNSVGVTTTIYKPWEQTIFDANANQRDLVFDARGNLITVREYVNGVSAETTYEYDAQNNLTKITDALGNGKNLEYDLLSRNTRAELLQAPTASEIYFWQKEYDENGNLTKTIDPRGQEIFYTYDELDRVLTETSDQQIISNYEYDTAVNGIGRIGKIVTPQSTKNFTYDLWGRIIQTEKIIEEIAYVTQTTFNLLDQPLTITYPTGKVINYTYNQAGLTEKITTLLADSEKVIIANLDYAPTGAYQKIEFGNGVITENTYDLQQLYRLTHKQTLLGTQKLQDLTYTFDPVGNIVALTENSDTLAAREVQYTYDELNRLTAASAVKTANGEDYTQVYSYDILGNLLSKSDVGNYTYTGSHPHAVTILTDSQQQTTNYEYDAAGNLVNTGAWTHTWDAKNTLVTATNQQTSAIINYSYDEAQTRIIKENLTEGTKKIYVNQYLDVEEDLSKNYVFVGDLKVATIIIEEEVSAEETEAEVEQPEEDNENFAAGTCLIPTTGDWILTESCNLEGFVTAPGDVYVEPQVVLTLEPNAVLEIDFHNHKLWIESAGGVLIQPEATLVQADYLSESTNSTELTSHTFVFHHSDHLSGASVTTAETGEIVELIDYFPFGSTRLEETASSYENAYKFTGKELDAETDLYYYGARYYAAGLGRFVSIDPWEGDFTNPQTLNKYAYVVNNPLKYVDPSGEVFETAWDLANVGYDLGRGLFNVGELIGDGINYATGVLTGNEDLQQMARSSAQENLGDLGEVAIDVAADAAATMIPFVPAGTTKAVRGVGKVKDKGKVVIGENMQERVIPAAKEMGANYYKPRSKNPNNFMKNNKQWIQKQMRDGKEIIDIGRDPKRVQKGIKESSFYKMEKREIKKKKYKNPK